MTRLPPLLRYLPYVLYVVAFLIGIYQFAANLSVIWATEGQAFDPSGKDKAAWLSYLITSQPFAMGISEAAYMAANGGILHVLIAIYDKMTGAAK